MTEMERAEREDLVRSLDVLAGVMACLVAMEERPREFVSEPSSSRRWRTGNVAAHWLQSAREAA